MAASSLSSSHDETMSEINITPFTDVLLVLIIIFMVTAAAVVQNSIKVNLPQAVSSQQADQQCIVATVTREGKVLVDGTETAEADLLAALKTAKDAKKTDKLLVVADHDVTYGHVVAVIDSARQAGLTSVGLASRPKG